MIPFILLAIVGLALLITGIVIKKNYRIVLIILGSIMFAIGAVMVIITIYFAWAVANDAPGPYEEDPETGADWRTWQSYSADYEIKDGVTVCMAVFGDGSGYAVYDSETGDRLGSLVVIGITGQEDFVTNDLDGDGINELGVVFPAGIEYFRYTGEPWIDGEGGGCFEPLK